VGTYETDTSTNSSAGWYSLKNKSSVSLVSSGTSVLKARSGSICEGAANCLG
jgi:hypothetical protein